MSEYGKRCGLCKKNKRSRVFFKQIKGKYRKICRECWGKELQRLGIEEGGK